MQTCNESRSAVVEHQHLVCEHGGDTEDEDTHPNKAKVGATVAVDIARLEKGLARRRRRATSGDEGQEDGEGEDGLEGELHS